MAPETSSLLPCSAPRTQRFELGRVCSTFVWVFLSPPPPQGEQINEAACNLAREVANEGGALVAGGVSQTPSYLSCKSDAEVKAVFKKQLDVFVKHDVDFLIAEVCCGTAMGVFLQTLGEERTQALNLRHMRLLGRLPHHLLLVMVVDQSSRPSSSN